MGARKCLCLINEGFLMRIIFGHIQYLISRLRMTVGKFESVDYQAVYIK
jgi:hypothetical protein